MAIPKYIVDILNRQTAPFSDSISQPAITKPADSIAPKTVNKWDELGLQERTKLVREMESHFKNNGRENPNMSDLVQLCQWGYSPRSSDIQMYLNGSVKIDELEPRIAKESNPISLRGSLTEACKNVAEENRRKEYMTQQLINEAHKLPEEKPKTYVHYY
jgi:hypothetical protein